MSNTQYEPPRERPYTMPLQLMAGAGALFLLSIGLCGVGAMPGMHGEGFFVSAGLFALAGSGIALLVSVIWLVIAAITSRS